MTTTVNVACEIRVKQAKSSLNIDIEIGSFVETRPTPTLRHGLQSFSLFV